MKGLALTEPFVFRIPKLVLMALIWQKEPSWLQHGACSKGRLHGMIIGGNKNNSHIWEKLQMVKAGDPNFFAWNLAAEVSGALVTPRLHQILRQGAPSSICLLLLYQHGFSERPKSAGFL